MPTTPHVEKHFTSSAIVRDIVIGMSDGLTVPFALAAGLTGAVDTTTIIITAGIAEIAAGSIAMGLGGYLAGRTDLEHFETERAREIRETEELPEKEKEEVAEILSVIRSGRGDREQSRQGDQRRPKAVGRFHDAVRVGPGRARPSQGQDQCSRDCRVLHRGRTGAVVSVLLLLLGESGIAGVCERDAGGLGGVRLRQRSVHRRQTAQKRIANCGRWRVGCCCCVRHCPHDWMTYMTPREIWIDNRLRALVEFAAAIAPQANLIVPVWLATPQRSRLPIPF